MNQSKVECLVRSTFVWDHRNCFRGDAVRRQLASQPSKGKLLEVRSVHHKTNDDCGHPSLGGRRSLLHQKSLADAPPPATSSLPRRSAEFLLRESHEVALLLQRAKSFQRTLRWTLAGLGLVTVALLSNWDKVKQRAGREGAEVLREGISSEDLRISAADFSKTLISQIIQDKKVADAVAALAVDIIHTAQPELEEVVSEFLRSGPVFAEIKRLADAVIGYLCSQSWVAEKIGELLLNAINTRASRDGAAQWTIGLLGREDVQAQIQATLHCSVLNDETVKAQAAEFAAAIVSKILSDPKMILSSQEHLAASASNATWNVFKKALVPRWVAKNEPNQENDDPVCVAAAFDDFQDATTTATTTATATTETTVASTATTAAIKTTTATATTETTTATAAAIGTTRDEAVPHVVAMDDETRCTSSCTSGMSEVGPIFGTHDTPLLEENCCSSKASSLSNDA